VGYICTLFFSILIQRYTALPCLGKKALITAWTYLVKIYSVVLIESVTYTFPFY
jgi:hypothetical protein